MDTTPNLGLPYIVAAQSQKHVTHNEAIRALDALVQLSVLDRDLSAPPGSPADGARYIVAASPTGAWAGHAGSIAAYQDGAWAFYEPAEGLIVWIADEDVAVVWSGSAWTALATGRRQRQLHDRRHQRHRRCDEPARGGGGRDLAQPRRRRASAEDQQGRGRRHREPALPGRLLGPRGARARRRRRLPLQSERRRSTWKEAIVIDRSSGVVALPFTFAGGRSNSIADGRLTLESGVPVSTTSQTAKTTALLHALRLATASRSITARRGPSPPSPRFPPRCPVLRPTPTTTSSATPIGHAHARACRVDGRDDARDRACAAGRSAREIGRGDAALPRHAAHDRHDGPDGVLLRRHRGGRHGSQALSLWNAQNRVDVAAIVGETADCWTYGTATVRAANNSTGMRVSFVQGSNVEPVRASYGGALATGTAYASVGVGLDSTSAFAGLPGALPGSGTVGSAFGHYDALAGEGFHYLAGARAAAAPARRPSTATTARRRTARTALSSAASSEASDLPAGMDRGDAAGQIAVADAVEPRRRGSCRRSAPGSGTCGCSRRGSDRARRRRPRASPSRGITSKEWKS